MQSKTFRLYTLSACAVLVVVLVSAAAVADGEIEINALCVSNGCFSGDAPGFPVEITQPGSYRLTSNLEIDLDTTAIEINASAVNLDLGGFSILGPRDCSTGTCIGTGSGHGVSVLPPPSASFQTFSLVNGTIRGTGSDCVSAFTAVGRVLDLSLENCGDVGLGLGGGQVQNISVILAAGVGIGTNSAHVRDSYVVGSSRGQQGGFCGNNVFASNDFPSICTAVGPNEL